MRARALGPSAALAAYALLTSVGAAPLAGQSWAGWNAYWENDSFVYIGGSDDAFTNGVRLTVVRHPNAPSRTFDWLSGWLARHPLVDRAQGRDAVTSVVVGQNFFTPREITTYEVNPSDRPYAGLWYVGLRSDLTERAVEVELEGGAPGETRPRPFQSLVQQSVELNVGILGQGAGANAVQSSVHAVFSTHRIPKGWSHQITNTPALAAQYMARWKLGWHVFDVVPHGGVLLGTTQTYPFAGLTTRLGWRMTGFPALIGRQTAVGTQGRPDWEAGVLAGVEGRYFLLNSFVEGTLTGDRGIEPVRPVGEARLGFWVRLQDWRLDYSLVRRSPEVAEPGLSENLYDNYGSVSVGYEPGDAAGPGAVDWLMNDVLARVLDDFILEAGIGPDLNGDSEAGVARTRGMHIALGRALPRSLPGILRDFDVAFELVGSGREFERDATIPVLTAYHADRFLVNKLLTLRYRPAGGRLGPGELHLRAGIGSAMMEYEVTPDDPGPRSGPCPPGLELDAQKQRFCSRSLTGRGHLVGGGYSLDFGSSLGLNTDLAWNRVDLDPSYRFLALTFGFRWAPRGP